VSEHAFSNDSRAVSRFLPLSFGGAVSVATAASPPCSQFETGLNTIAWSRSSAGQSSGFLNRRSQVRVLPGPPDQNFSSLYSSCSAHVCVGPTMFPTRFVPDLTLSFRRCAICRRRRAALTTPFPEAQPQAFSLISDASKAQGRGACARCAAKGAAERPNPSWSHFR
jgi:hypothetical protein